jgi:DNA-binding protein H-NS
MLKGAAMKKTPIVAQFKTLPLEQQAELLLELGNHYDLARIDRIKSLAAEMKKLQSHELKAIPANVKRMATGEVKKRVKASAKYRSLKDKSLKWSGRGSLPKFLRDEMKATRKPLSAFLIDKRK